jgi:hypothetical protein
MNTDIFCPCGSGLTWWRLFDASVIYCGRVCDRCEAEKRSKYRPEIFTNPDYETDEPKEPEE